MFLPGRLRSTTLGDLLGTLHRARVSGELELIGRDPPFVGHRHRISVRDGLVTDVRTVLPVPPLGEVLLGEGGLTEEQHQQLLGALRLQRGRRVGEIAIGLGLVSRDRIASALGKQIRLRLDALFELRDADVRFHPLPRGEERRGRLGPSEFLHGRRRARENQSPDRTVNAPSDPALSRAFQLLGLAPSAARTDVRRAFRRLASTAHPDLHTHLPAAQRRALESRLTELSQAYHTIITRCEPTTAL